MADRVEQLHAELAGLLAAARADAHRRRAGRSRAAGRRCGWRPGSRPTRPERKVSAFLDFFDRAEQQELTDRTLAGGSVDELRLAFRERLAAGAQP